MPDKISSDSFIQNLVIFVVCAIGLVAFWVLIILPSQRTEKELDQEIDKLNGRIEEQRILTPVFHSLLERAKMKGSSELPAPEKSKLTYGDMNTISKEFQDIARRNNLKLDEITTDVNSLMQESGYLVMQLRLSGDFFDFRKFLVDIGSIPSLEHREESKIQPGKASKELSLKIWLAQ
jgi:Tfp pilus assembly protein PilO